MQLLFCAFLKRSKSSSVWVPIYFSSTLSYSDPDRKNSDSPVGKIITYHPVCTHRIGTSCTGRLRLSLMQCRGGVEKAEHLKSPQTVNVTVQMQA